MSKNERINKQLFIIDGQLIGAILYIVSIIISIIIILDQRRVVLNNDRILTDNEAQSLALANKIFIFLLIIWFLYLNYKSYEFAKNTNQDTTALKLQIFSSLLTIITGIIGIYVVYTNFENTNLQTAEIENPNL